MEKKEETMTPLSNFFLQQKKEAVYYIERNKTQIKVYHFLIESDDGTLFKALETDASNFSYSITNALESNEENQEMIWPEIFSALKNKFSLSLDEPSQTDLSCLLSEIDQWKQEHAVSLSFRPEGPALKKFSVSPDRLEEMNCEGSKDLKIFYDAYIALYKQAKAFCLREKVLSSYFKGISVKEIIPGYNSICLYAKFCEFTVKIFTGAASLNLIASYASPESQAVDILHRPEPNTFYRLITQLDSKPITTPVTVYGFRKDQGVIQDICFQYSKYLVDGSNTLRCYALGDTELGNFESNQAFYKGLAQFFFKKSNPDLTERLENGSWKNAPDILTLPTEEMEKAVQVGEKLKTKSDEEIKSLKDKLQAIQLSSNQKRGEDTEEEEEEGRPQCQEGTSLGRSG